MRRRFHAFSVGGPRTGTNTIARMFSQAGYRAAHEPATAMTNYMAVMADNGYASSWHLVELLKHRDMDLNLELESSYPLGYLAAQLSKAFPHSLFIVTVRDPFSWLRSRLNYHHEFQDDNPRWVRDGQPQGAMWKALRSNFWRGEHDGYDAQDSFLARYGLLSVVAYLASYERHFKIVIKGIPEERRLCIRTDRLSSQRARSAIAKVLDIPDTLPPMHSNRSKNYGIFEQLPVDWVRAKIKEYCPTILETLWPKS